MWTIRQLHQSTGPWAIPYKTLFDELASYVMVGYYSINQYEREKT